MVSLFDYAGTIKSVKLSTLAIAWKEVVVTIILLVFHMNGGHVPQSIV